MSACDDGPMTSSAEHVLEGGNVADVVVRVGSTVRKPAGPATAAVEALLDHLAGVGFQGAPRSLGRDEFGRHILEYVPGEMAFSLPPLTAPQHMEGVVTTCAGCIAW